MYTHYAVAIRYQKRGWTESRSEGKVWDIGWLAAPIKMLIKIFGTDNIYH